MVNFLGIGAQKCASSWIYEVLNNSEQTCLSEVKELDFFSYYYDKGYEWYLSNFDDLDKKIIGEVSPSYFYNSDVPRRVHQYNSDMKIVLSLRDPIKRMFSNHLHEVRAGNVSEKNTVFENAFSNNPLYLEQSQYAVHLKKWLSYFELENIHVVFQEEVKLHPQRVSNDLCDFLELEHLALQETVAVNASLQNKNQLVGSAFELGGGVLRKLKLKGVVNELKNSKLLGPMYSSNKVHISDLVKPIDEEFEQNLRTQLQESDNELKALLALDTLPWEVK